MSKYSYGLSLCQNCDSYFGYPEELDKAMIAGCKEKGVYSAIATCQCGESHIAGGEACEDGIMLSSHEYSPDDGHYENHDKFDVVMLTKCNADDPECVASAYVSFGYFLNPESTSRTICLKPGKPTYIFRNLPCNCSCDNIYQIRWCVSGHFQGMSGVLEWCKSYTDAFNVINRMKLKADPQHDQLYIEPFEIVSAFGNRMIRYLHRSESRLNVTANVKDVVMFEWKKGCAIGHVNTVFDYDKHTTYEIYLWDYFRTDGEATDAETQTGLSTPLGRFVSIDESKLIIVITKARGVPRPRNAFRSYGKSVGCYERPIYQMIAQLQFYVPDRRFRMDAFDMFHAQHPMRQDGSFNKKLFMKWLRRNLFKLLDKKSHKK